MKNEFLKAREILLRKLNDSGFQIEHYHNNKIILRSDGGITKLTIFFGGGEHFQVYAPNIQESKWFCYVWNCEYEPEFHFLNTDQVLDVLGPQPLKSKSWIDKGYYKWSSSTGIPSGRKTKILGYSDENWSKFFLIESN